MALKKLRVQCGTDSFKVADNKLKQINIQQTINLIEREMKKEIDKI